MFQLSAEEWAALRSQFATLGAGGRGQHRKYLPYAFTEHGAIMAANLLSSPRAIEVSLYVVRAFVRLRELAVTHGDLAKRLDELERKTEALALSHETLQPQHALACEGGVRCAARVDDAARSAEAAHRVRHAGGQEQEGIGFCKKQDLIPFRGLVQRRLTPR